MKKESDFGKGLVICLVKFAEHFERDDIFRLLNGDLNEQQKVICKDVYNNDKEKYISHSIELWANGASDHLYQIEVPKGKEWNEIRALVKELHHKGLEIGHGFTNKTWTYKDLSELVRLTHNIALLIDKKLGLKAERGIW
ncbi:hypothetical protein M0R04_11060 [Candidatus Dojkabacteria bacterium]|jgi:hypothetical protein|nr:hypothetical protein [Candidatus Dojkabacteria bacterium]